MSYRDYAQDIVIPALLRSARLTYSQSVRDSLSSAGFEDMPKNGPYILGGMANQGGELEGLIRGLGVTKQAASQLIDLLVIRGYLTREEHPEDRRRLLVQLTERGRAAAEAVAAGVGRVDDELATMLSEEEIATMRVGLAALCDIRELLTADH